MDMKKGPLIFLGVLIIALFFILGVQYGKRVQTADEALKLLLTIAPSPSISPSEHSQRISIQEFDSNSCGFSFLYPSTIQPKKLSSTSGEFIDKEHQSVISFDCQNKQASTAEATKASTLDSKMGIEYTQNNATTVQVEHPLKDYPISITFTSEYSELIKRTFEFQ